MENYHFFIGTKNINTAEIIKVLEEKSVPYTILDSSDNPGYVAAHTELNERKPVFVGIEYLKTSTLSFQFPYLKWDNSPLYKTLQLLGCEHDYSDLQNRAMIYNQGIWDYRRQDAIADLAVAGYTRKEIEETQLHDRQARNIPAKFEAQAEKAVKDCLIKSNNKDLLTVYLDSGLTWKDDFKNYYLAVSDRLFWHQKFSNFLIIDKNIIVYNGFIKVQNFLMNDLCLNSQVGFGTIFLFHSYDKERLEEIASTVQCQTAKFIQNGTLL